MIKLKQLITEALASISVIDNHVKIQLATAAQAVYDEWIQDEAGEDSNYGVGGICDDIAQAMAGVLSDYGVENVQTQYNEPHTYVIAQFQEGIFTIDIPFSVYEKGNLYIWKKIQGVKFDPSHIDIYKLDPDHSKWEEYTGDY
jgi:hypothetical protein